MSENYTTIDELLDDFFSGKREGSNGIDNTGNLRINNGVLIHYKTPLLERNGDEYILNTSAYSRTTGVLQNRLRNKIRDHGFKFCEVRGVPKDYSESLIHFVKEKNT